MLRKEITICNKLGLHARAAAKFVTLAAQFTSDIQLARGPQQVNGKSIMGVMMLAASQGTGLEIIACGADEIEACQQLGALVERRFDEAE
ncbi:MAG: HPr family phosphocarrier protein [Gammaproteobacteria bacterium]